MHLLRGQLAVQNTMFTWFTTMGPNQSYIKICQFPIPNILGTVHVCRKTLPVLCLHAPLSVVIHKPRKENHDLHLPKILILKSYQQEQDPESSTNLKAPLPMGGT